MDVLIRAQRALVPCVTVALAGAVTGCASTGARVAPPVTAWNSPGFHVIAHRGGAGHAPENTLPALRQSLARGFNEVEVDVQLSLDEEPVLYHDSTLERKTGHSGSVSVYSAEELRAFEIGSWFDAEFPDSPTRFSGTRLNTVSEMFEAFGASLYYHLELKGDHPLLLAKLLDRVNRAGLRDRVMVSAFSFEQIERVTVSAPDLPVCWLLDRNRDLDADDSIERIARQKAQLGRAAAAGVEQVAVRADELTPEVVQLARARGLSIRAWGVRRGDEQRLIGLGIDGATSDWPELLRARIGR
jgi:glycerophosphoryl diester phosphodiesterase